MVRKTHFVPGWSFPKEALDRNREANKGHVRYSAMADVPAGTHLAVIGGGPSVKGFLDELKAWAGDIWAINGAFGWCLDNGIDATFYTLDASPVLKDMASRAGNAILADNCDPDVSGAVNGSVHLVEMGDTPCGSSSASTAPMLAALRGYSSVTLFGCESSFVGAEHAYQWSHVTTSRVLVECDGREFLTTPQLIMQAEYVAEIARNVPGYVSVRGIGFLPALIVAGDYSILKVSRDILGGSGGH